MRIQINLRKLTTETPSENIDTYLMCEKLNDENIHQRSEIYFTTLKCLMNLRLQRLASINKFIKNTAND